MTTKRDEELLASIGMTPEEAERRAAEFEAGTWDRSEYGEVRRGRPSIADEEVRVYSVRFPVSLMEYVSEEADANGITRSEELRRIVAAHRRSHKPESEAAVA